MKSEIEFSRNDSFVLVISFIKVATFVQGVAVNGITIQHYCTVLKYLFRATAVLQIKTIERDPAYQSFSVKNRVAIQLEILPLIPKDATVNQTYPFGRLNAFAADIARLSGVVKRPLIEDQTMESRDLGAAIVAQQPISLPLLLKGVEMMLSQASEIVDDLLLGFNFTTALLDIFDKKYYTLSDSGTFSMIPEFCIGDWVTLKLKHQYFIDPVHCDIDKFSYFLSTDPSTRSARIQSYIEQCDTLTDILITLVHLTSGPCARATELATTFYRNCPESQRSLIFSNGYLCLLYTYNKTNALTGSIKTIVRPIANPVAKQLLLYSVLIRPFKERLVGIRKNSVAWKSMWVRGNNQITAEQVRSAIQFYSSKYNIRLSIKLSRQYISWICVKYLNYIDVEMDIYSGFGHSKTTSLNHYAHTSTESANIDRDSWNAMIKTAVSYQKLLFGINLEPTIKSQTQIVSTRHFRNNDLNSNSPSLSINAPEMTFFENYNVKEDFQMGIYLKKGLKDYMQFGVDKIGIFIDNLN